MYIHEEFKRLLHVLKKDSMVAHESCTCTCGFCADGNCKVVFESDMDLYWCMRHLLCPPAKLYSQTSRNLFPPSFCLCSHSSFINGFLLLRLPSVCSCLDGRCSNTSPSQIKRRLYNSRQHRTHKCNSRAKPLNLFWGHEEGAWIPHGCSRHKISKRLQLVMEPAYGWKNS